MMMVIKYVLTFQNIRKNIPPFFPDVKAVMSQYSRGYECIGDQLPADIVDKCPEATCEFLKYGTRDTAQYLQVLIIY